MRNENWKLIPNYEFYEVSDKGRIRSIDKIFVNISQRIVKKGKIRKLSKTIYGYLQITLVKNNNPKSFRVHRLVAELFIPNPNKYPQVNHIDGNKLNNNVENLE